jgi:hypothetical protein
VLISAKAVCENSGAPQSHLVGFEGLKKRWNKIPILASVAFLATFKGF